MQLKQGVNVSTADGHDLGRIERVVIDPQTREITHIVVHKGLLMTHDKVIPFDLIASADDDSIVLKAKADSLPDLPDFEAKHYVMANGEEWTHSSSWMGEASPLLWYPPIGAAALGYYPDHLRQRYRVETDRNIPAGTIPLKEGAKVLSADDKHMGDVERVLTSKNGEDRITHLVISNGVLLRERRLIPVTWVNTIKENEVHLAVGARLLSTLPAYSG